MDLQQQYETYLKIGWSDYEKSGDWLRFRKRWLKDNPPLDNGYYLCGICARWVSAEEVTLDHIEPRRADNIFSYENIQPAHGLCNYLKGSKRWKPKVDRDTYKFLEFLSNI